MNYSFIPNMFYTFKQQKIVLQENESVGKNPIVLFRHVCHDY